MNITGFNPTQGGDGTAVTINITNMPADASIDNTYVQLAGLPSVNVTGVDAQAGTVDLDIGPTSQTGDFDVVINSPSIGIVHDTSAQVFTVPTQTGQPRITSAPGAALRNTMVTLNGLNLTGAEFVRIGSATVMNIQVTANAIRFTLPATVPLGPQRVCARYQEWGLVYAPKQITVVTMGADEADDADRPAEHEVTA